MGVEIKQQERYSVFFIEQKWMSINRFDAGVDRSQCGFSDAQKRFIKTRDQTCRVDCELTRFCGGPDDTLSVHHIKPRKVCREAGINPNTLGNGITVCDTYHVSEHRECPPGLNWNPQDDSFLRRVVANLNRQLFAGEHESFPYASRPLEIRKRAAKLFGGWHNLGAPRM